MKCPIDQNELVMTDRQGIEIDYCPKCRGVWLDRGELDKLIERSAPAPQAATPQAAPWPQQQYQQHQGQDRHYKHKKKKSFLSDVFDF